MKRLLLLIFFCISLIGCTQTFKINQAFEDKTSKTFIVKRAKIDSQEPMSKDLAQETEISATFENFENNIKCTWTYLDTKAILPDSLRYQLTPEWNDLINIYKGIKIEFEINKEGKYLKLLNLNECQRQIEDATVKMYKNKNVKIDSAIFIQLRTMLKPTYENEKILIGTYFKEIFLYFNILGETFEKGIGIEEKNVIPNPFGGEQFPVTDKIEISDVNDSILTIENNQIPVSKEYNRILKETMVQLSKQVNNPLKKDELPDLEITGKTSYYYNLKKNQMSKVILNKVVKVSGITQTEILEVRMKN
jgi:hypothetical protein